MQTPGRRLAARRLALWLALGAVAANAQPSRISQRIDNTLRTVLTGHIRPQARPENDQGRASPALPLPYVTLTLAPSDAQAAELEQLLAGQQTPGSPDYHRWLTPEQYAQRFGVSESDMSQIAGWLQAQGLTVVSTARARNWIAVSGTAAQIENAFQIQLHHYLVDGETHYANADEPSVPAAFAGVVRSIQGLTDFRLKPAARPMQNQPADPRYTCTGSAPVIQPCVGYKGEHYIAPDDLATIYDIKPLYTAGVDGTGQKIVIAGQTRINLSDIEQFRSSYGLPANDPQTMLVPNTQDPGISSSDLPEADLDLEWSGAVARNASIIFVYSYDVMDAVQYAVDQDLAPVISTSYGLCEVEMGSERITLQTWAQQANSQGITWLAASGDSGGADCDDTRNTGLAVDAPASIPEVTGVGGTEFNEGSGAYWSATNSATGASALSYIPEVVWNDSTEDGQPAASGGGSSGYFPRPSWQTGPGVPNDNFRHVPDVALAASADHDGYFVYTGGSTQIYGGTSFGAPTFAGMAALINQYMVYSGAQASPGLGNMNPKLYTLAQTTSGVFHDIVTGNNIVTIPCPTRSRSCTSSAVGYSAGPGYDQTTGWGSVDAYRLVAAWDGASTITGPRSSSPPTIGGLANGASFQQAYAPGMIVSVFGTQLAPSSQAASSVPLPLGMAGVSATVNNVPAPFYYVSQGQLNVQIPYETGIGPATLVVNNNGQTVSQPFTVAALAPGIFTDQNDVVVPFGSAAPGDTITLYITGAGAVNPPVATGAAPDPSTPLANLPAPVQSTTVTVGGLAAPYVWTGIPWGLVGVVQVNYQVPSGVGLGEQPVVVSVGGVASAAAILNITN
ncbi:MAG: protease pro-enzyme activation domain-containing protein [Bryobacteraceae bacterium]